MPAPLQIEVRRATLSDVPALGVVGARAQDGQAVVDYLSPHRHRYPISFRVACTQRIRARYLSGEKHTLIALEAGKIAGYIQYTRHRRSGVSQPVDRPESWFVLKAWVLWNWLEPWIWPDRSKADQKTMRKFFDSVEVDEARYWDSEPEKYGERYHVETLMVDPTFQRRGVGKKLMNEVLKAAMSEGIPVGLEASPGGAGLYKQLGFTKRGDYTIRIPGELGTDAGVMVWENDKK